MNMKPITYILLFCAAIVIMPACNKKLDVQPQNNLTADQIKTSDDVIAILFGAYSGLQSPGAFGEGYILTPDLLASDSQVIYQGTFTDYLNVNNKNMVSTNLVATNLWGFSYSIINLANTVIDKISLVDSADRGTVQGEALFIRATAHFYLTGLFAKPYSDGNATTNLGVPILLKPTYVYDSTKAGKPARSTVDQVYTQVINDLLAAIPLLDSNNVNYRATVFSAKAILSRVYLSMGRYTDAANQANDVINSNLYTLSTLYAKEFNNDGNTAEDLFAIQNTSQSNGGTSNNGLTTFYASAPSGRGEVVTDPNYFNFFEASDTRGTFFNIGKTDAGATGVAFTNKWMTFFKTIPVARLAEMYLTRGECNLLTGASIGGVTPLSDINTVRSRAGASTLSSVGQQDFIDERFRELAFEGDRYWTLKRIHQNISGLSYDDNMLIMPIPQSEIDVNKNLVQNQGY